MYFAHDRFGSRGGMVSHSKLTVSLYHRLWVNILGACHIWSAAFFSTNVSANVNLARILVVVRLLLVHRITQMCTSHFFSWPSGQCQYGNTGSLSIFQYTTAVSECQSLGLLIHIMSWVASNTASFIQTVCLVSAGGTHASRLTPSFAWFYD